MECISRAKTHAVTWAVSPENAR